MFIAFSSAAGLRQHFKRQESCRTAKIPGAFSLSQNSSSVVASLSLGPPAESVQYLLSENTQGKPQFPCLDIEDNREESSHFHRENHDGIIAHVDDSGAETTLFLEHDSPYSSTTPSFIVQSTPMDVERFVGPNLLQRSQIVDSVQTSQLPPVKASEQIGLTTSTLLVNATESSEQMSVSNLEAFPFTLTVESTQEQM